MRKISKFTAMLLPLLLAGPASAQPKKAATAETRSGAGIYDSNPANAVKAAKELGASKSPQAVDTLLDALAMGLHPEVAAAALEALGAKASAKSFDTVDYYLHHRNPKVREAALVSMGKLADKRAMSRVLLALRDGHKSVRAVAADLAARSSDKRAVEPLIELLKKGDEASAPALASMANPDLARTIGELIGSAPDGLLSRCLGAILMRPDFKPEDARVEVVKALGKIPGNDSLEQLTNYVGSVPENPPRQSRREAEGIIEARMGGG